MLRPLMLAAALACPVTLTAQFKPADPKHPRTLSITSPLPPAQTIAQLTTVLIAREYTIDRADGTAVVCAPRQYKNTTMFTLRSNVVPTAMGSTVVLSGTYDLPIMGVKDEPVEGNRPRLQGELWREMEAVGAALPAAISGASQTE
jgi:hypothetical protein